MKQLLNARVILAILGLCILSVGLSSAQINGSFTTCGTVFTPLFVTGSDLDFGNAIFPGINKHVLPTDLAAGKFTISGEASKEFTATFTVPTELTSGLNNMPFAMNATDGGAKSTNNQATATSFNPASMQTWTLSGAGYYYVWLGGTITPAHSQAAGMYSGIVEVDVQYTGN